MIASKMLPIILLVAVYLQLAHSQGCTDRMPTFAGSCVNISDSSGCGVFYGHSFFPNNITDHGEGAERFLRAYRPFYSKGSTYDCSAYAHIFVCTALFPVCDPSLGSTRLRPPCRDLCDQVLSDCLREIQGLPGGSDFDISCLLDCNRYRATGDCVARDDPLVVRVVNPPTIPAATTQPAITRNEPENATSVDRSTSNGTDGTCPTRENSYFGQAERVFAKGWLAFWATGCFISTLVTLLTFLLDPSRFHYPWRPVIYLALSFNLHAAGYIFSLILGRMLVTCPRNEFVSISISWHWEHVPCLLIFSVLYYTMIAAFLWWLVLAFCWFLASSFKWSNEAVGHLAPFFHVLAWVLPLLLTISLMAARVVSADELTATCFIVRDQSTRSFLALLIGVILPLIICLVIGVVFLVIGFVSTLKIHSFMREGGKEKESLILEKLMIRIGIFVTVYIIPAAVVIGCFVYELESRPNWTTLDTCPSCPKPNTAVFMVRLFMFLLIGVLTGVWIWSRKTLNLWLSLPQRIRNCGASKESVDIPQDKDVELQIQPYPTRIHSGTNTLVDSADDSA